MNTQYIKDSNGAPKFIIQNLGSYKQILDYRSSRLLGSFRNGNTYNSNGTLVARGEDLSTLSVG